MCAFYAFQANKEQGVGLKRYKSNKESKRRLVHFTQCVKTVKKMNSNFESGKTTFSGGIYIETVTTRVFCECFVSI